MMEFTKESLHYHLISYDHMKWDKAKGSCLDLAP